MEKRILRELAERVYPEYVAFCRKMIQTPSEQSQEGDAAALYCAELQRLGYDEVFTDDWGSVVGIIHGTEPGPVIAYNGHIDVVTPGDESLWSDPPYSGIIRETSVAVRDTEEYETAEAIHGRGSSDMKCGGAAQAYAGAILLELRKQGYPLKGTFMLQQVVLEENGEAMGTSKLLDYLKKNNYPLPDAGVFGEPTSLNLCLGHRGRMELRITVYGKSCHGSCPWEGINAMEKAALLITEIGKEIAGSGREDEDLGRSSITLTMLTVEPCELCILPNKVTMVYDRRLVPGETPSRAVDEIERIINRLKAQDPEFQAEVEVNSNLRYAYTGKSDRIKSQKEACKMEKEHPFIQACGAGLTDVGISFAYKYLSASTDLPPFIWGLHKPAVLFSGGQMDRVHQPDENARLDYLKESIAGNAAIYLRTAALPMDAFTV